MVALYPSLLCADQLSIGVTIQKLAPYCVGFHIDVMDNHLVPNLEGSVSMINAIASVTKNRLWVHLMVENPTNLIEHMQLRPDDIVSFHGECSDNLLRVVKSIKEIKCVPSIAISPKTDLQVALRVLDRVNHILVMSVEPGFAGQQFLTKSYDRLVQLVAYKNDRHPTLTIAIDGGVTSENIEHIIQAGAQDLVVGSAIFQRLDPVQAFVQLQKQVE